MSMLMEAEYLLILTQICHNVRLIRRTVSPFFEIQRLIGIVVLVNLSFTRGRWIVEGNFWMGGQGAS